MSKEQTFDVPALPTTVEEFTSIPRTSLRHNRQLDIGAYALGNVRIEFIRNPSTNIVSLEAIQRTNATG